MVVFYNDRDVKLKEEKQKFYEKNLIKNKKI